jgi:DNA replication initiation complex subunit (GINS family)
MADDRLWTAAELEKLSFEERQVLLNERVITDLSQVPPDFLERVQAHARALLEERGLIARKGDDT